MWKIRASTKKPFWTNNNENVPSLKVFNDFLNNEMVELEKFNINYINNLNGQIVSDNEYQYLEIKNDNKTYYYYVNSIDKILKDHKTGKPLYVLNINIDIYCSYTIKFIYDNLDKELLFLRTHDYNKKCLQVADQFLDEIPKIYNEYYFRKLLFNYDENNKIWYSDQLGIKNNDDLVNANRYYVFKDGPNGSYTFYPILSISKNVEVFYQEQTKTDIKDDLYFWNGRAANSDRVEISDELNNKIVEAYKNGNIVEYAHRVVASGIYLKGWKTISNVPYGTLPVDVRTTSNQWNQAGAGIKQASFDCYVLGNNVYHVRSGNTLAWDHSTQWESCKNFRQLNAKIYNTTLTWKNVSVKNSITDLETLRKQEANINKFLGIFYLPHFLNFDTKRLNFKNGYVSFNISPQQDHIRLFKIYNYQLSNINNKINNSSYSTEYFLKYLNIKYYGNHINAEYRTNDQHSIYLGGKLFFTDSASIVSKSNELLTLDQSIISFPYQLPIGVDTYEQYVKANRNVTETGFNIEREKQQLNFAKGIVNTYTGVASGAAKVAGGMVTGDIGAVIKGSSEIMNTTTNAVFGNIALFQGLDHTARKITAQYQQVNNTRGNEMQFSNIKTAALLEYYNDSSGDQYEGVEVSELDENILMLMNNFIYLNGYFLSNKSTFNKKINNDRLFNYIIVDSLLLDNLININYNSQTFNNNIYEMVKQQLINGLRIWNNISDDLPSYNPDKNWPDQPDEIRPVVPAPQPPQIPVEPDPEMPANSKVLTLEPTWHYTNLTYNDDYDETWGQNAIFLCGFNDTSFICYLNCYRDDDFQCGETPLYNDALIYNWNFDSELNGYNSVTIDCKNLKLENICAKYENENIKLYFLHYANMYEWPLYIINLDESVKKYFEDHNAFIKIDEAATIINLYINGVKYE